MGSTRIVLFLCTGNYYRSRFAEAYFNSVAVATGLGWRAESRALAIEWGSGNIGPMAPTALRELGELGIQPAEPLRHPLALSTADLVAADLVVAMNEAEHRPLLAARFPGWADRVSYWAVQDVPHTPSDVGLPALRRHVEHFIRSGLPASA